MAAGGSMNCLRKSNWKLCLGCLLALCLLGIFLLGYICPSSNCALRGKSSYSFNSNYDAYFAGRYLQNQFSTNELDKDYSVNIQNQDVVVFLHMQKTGGTTFGKHLVDNLKVDPPCTCFRRKKKRCDCLNNNGTVWLFSRYSTGWQCGLHADWTELKDCVDSWFHNKFGEGKRKFYYITLLRDPVPRFISEWMHVSQRGATWKTARLKCNGREATLDEVPFCHNGEEWLGVSLKEFMSCQANLAINRQARMLANLSKVNCYNTTGMSPEERNEKLLESAKENLLDLAFFGLTEYQTYTQFLFEHTLSMNFLEDFDQHQATHASRFNVSDEDLKAIAELNQLDIELYQFAKDLFLQRAKKAYIDDGIPVPDDIEKEINLSLSEEGGDEVRDSETSPQNDGTFVEVEKRGSKEEEEESSMGERSRGEVSKGEKGTTRSEDLQDLYTFDNNSDKYLDRGWVLKGRVEERGGGGGRILDVYKNNVIQQLSDNVGDKQNTVRQNDDATYRLKDNPRKGLPGFLGIDFDEALQRSGNLKESSGARNMYNSRHNMDKMPQFNSPNRAEQRPNSNR